MDSTARFEKMQADMSDESLIKEVEAQIIQLAKTYSKSHRMSIPPSITDTDMLLSELVRRYKLTIMECSVLENQELHKVQCETCMDSGSLTIGGSFGGGDSVIRCPSCSK